MVAMVGGGLSGIGQKEKAEVPFISLVSETVRLFNVWMKPALWNLLCLPRISTGLHAFSCELLGEVE